MSRHQAPSPAPSLAPAADALRARSIRRVTWVAILTNPSLAIAQVVIGLFANAFSLVADAAHTFSDLVTDLLVLLAGQHGADPADSDHPYGHGRIETATTLLLGAVLAAVGIGFLWSSGLRLQNMAAQPALHPTALAMAVLTLLAKEGLFRFTIGAARRLKSGLLEANAWHARSDAASSLVVAIGIGGSLAGFPFLEPLAAAVVGFIILSMGLRLGWKAIRELIDTGLGAEELQHIRSTITQIPGVVGVHELRTRRMAGRVLCDAHVQVAPRLTVSEGHRISDKVFLAVRQAHPEVRDILVHIDAEDDGELQTVPAGQLPMRSEILATLAGLFDDRQLPTASQVYLHYLGKRLDVEVLLPADFPPAAAPQLEAAAARLIADDLNYRSIRFFRALTH